MKNNKQDAVKVIQGLLDQDGIKGKKMLRDVLWLNTVEPKYQVGDLIKASDYSLRVGGEQVIGWNMKIAKVIYHLPWEQTYHYECVCQVINEGSFKDVTIHVRDRDIKGYAKDSVHVIEGKQSGFTEEIAVSI